MATPVLDTAAAYWRACDYDDFGFLVDGSGNGHDAKLGSKDIARISTDYDGAQCLKLPGAAGNYGSVPHSAALDIVGDIDIQCLARLDNWAPTVAVLATKWETSNYSFWFYVRSGGALRIFWTEDGSTLKFETSAAIGASSGDKLWVRVTMDVDNGAGDAEVKFWTGGSGDTPSWAQLGATQMVGATTSIFAGTAPVAIGAHTVDNYYLPGNIYRCRIYPNLTETGAALDVDFTAEATGTTGFTEDSTNAATVTVNQSGADTNDPTADGETPHELFALNANDFFHVADHGDLDFDAATDFTLVYVGKVDDATPVANQVLVAKKANLTTGLGYALYVHTDGTVRAVIGDGTNTAEDTIAGLTDATLFNAAFVRDATADTVEVFLNGTGSGSATNASALGTMVNALPMYQGALAGSSLFMEGDTAGWALFRGKLSGADQLAAADELMGIEAADEYDGDGSLALAPVAVGGTGTHTAPAYAGVGAVALAAMLLGGSGAYTPPDYPGDGGVTLAPVELVGTGTYAVPDYDGAGGITFAPIGLAGTGSYTPPDYAGDGGVLLAPISLAGTGGHTPPDYDGNGAFALAPIALSGTGSYGDTYPGDGAVALAPVGLEGTGAYAVPNYSGDGGLVVSPAVINGGGTYTDPVSLQALEGFRFFDDDDVEADSTPAQDQDTNHTVALDGTTRLRMLVQAPEGGQYQLEARVKTTGEWVKIVRP